MKSMAYIIAGPTASGKSALAHRLAQTIGGAVINCDSVQIYRGIENISASPFANRPLTDDIDGVPYRLFSILNLSEQISVADYLHLAQDEYKRARESGLIPIFVGGTGFYIDAIVRGLSPLPDISAETRQRARAMVATDSDAARAQLGPDAPRDPQRMARALEVLMETGRPLSYWHTMPRDGAITPTPRRILINPHRDILCGRIAARVPDMLAGGALDEARATRTIPGARQRAIGVDELSKYLDGEIDQDTAIQNWITRTNQYAKRQRTWFRTQFQPDVTVTTSDVNLDDVI